MKFINFTKHNLMPEQVESAKSIGATEIVDAKSVLPNFEEITNDDGNVDAIRQANEIAKAIVALADGKPAIIHFPVSSPRVQAAFWRRYDYWADPSFWDMNSEDYKIWEQVRKHRFVNFGGATNQIKETTMKKQTKYQVWGYDSTRNDFTLDGGEYEADDFKIAISNAENYENAIIEQYDVIYDEDGDPCDIANEKVVYHVLRSDEDEKFFKREFPHLF